MNEIAIGVEGAQVRLVADGAYYQEARRLMTAARSRLLCSLFIVDLATDRDPEQKVNSLLYELSAARWRGVDARLLVGGSRDNVDIAELGLSAVLRAAQVGLPCRLLAVQDVRGSHVKLVIADDWVLTGSHNWSGGAFTGQLQDSVLVRSADLAAYLGVAFERGWRRAGRREEA
jgi:phosphatidylserine/phosphatidylglycerophosphate/cardiolipin synthase-like enzyme